MAAGTFTLFSKNLNVIDPADVVAATIKFALVTSTYTPDSSVTGNSLWADASANEITTAGGYTTGGATLATAVATAITGGYKVSSANVSWTASGGSIDAWRYAVMYLSGTVWSLVNPLIGYFVGDSTPADVPATTVGNTLQLTCPTNGWFDVT